MHFCSLQHLQTSLQNDPQMGPKMIPKSFQIGAGGLSKAVPKISKKISSKTTPPNLILEPKWSQKASPKWRSAHTLFEAFFGAAVWMAFLPHFDGFWPPGGLPFGAHFRRILQILPQKRCSNRGFKNDAFWPVGGGDIPLHRRSRQPR